MTVIADSLGARDVARLARMHVEAIPESLISRVGERYARAFYRYVAKSEDELLLVERDGREIIGGCLVSLAPETLSGRMLRHTPLAVLAPLALHRLPLRAMLRGLTEPRGAPKPPGAEILLIFTDAARRSRGLGARLLARCEALLAARGVDKLLVQTRDDPANRAVQFYDRARFERIAARSKYGKRLILFEKPLRGSP